MAEVLARCSLRSGGVYSDAAEMRLTVSACGLAITPQPEEEFLAKPTKHAKKTGNRVSSRSLWPEI